jgi:RNA polymerase sigma-70 factor (ECF subfamily)
MPDSGSSRDRAQEGESSLELLALAQQGDASALERLCARYLPRLRRWATGRLPRWARDLSDTDDVVQETVMATLARLGTFEPRHEGALQAYLRQAVLNRIRDQVRRAQRLPSTIEVAGNEVDRAASPLDEAIGREAVDRYEAALARLRPVDREAIHLRIELNCDFARVAEALGKPTEAAARVAVSRALVRLAEEMDRGE